MFSILILFSALPELAFSANIKPFTTDGCSAFPNGTIAHQSLWVNCCIRHDLAYWKGGTYNERLDADRAMESCVSQVGETGIAKIMLAGVRVGGSPYFPTPYRWGYGWPYPRGYTTLSGDEKREIKSKLEIFEIMIRNIYRELNIDSK